MRLPWREAFWFFINSLSSSTFDTDLQHIISKSDPHRRGKEARRKK